MSMFVIASTESPLVISITPFEDTEIVLPICTTPKLSWLVIGIS